MRYIEDETPSLLGRCIGAGMATFFAALTTLAVPLFLAWSFPIKFGVLFPTMKIFAMYGFYFWMAVVALYAMVIGFVYGGYAVLDIFNLIWGTGETNDRELKDTADHLRLIIPLTGVVSLGLIVLMEV